MCRVGSYILKRIGNHRVSSPPATSHPASKIRCWNTTRNLGSKSWLPPASRVCLLAPSDMTFLGDVLFFYCSPTFFFHLFHFRSAHAKGLRPDCPRFDLSSNLELNTKPFFLPLQDGLVIEVQRNESDWVVRRRRRHWKRLAWRGPPLSANSGNPMAEPSVGHRPIMKPLLQNPIQAQAVALVGLRRQEIRSAITPEPDSMLCPRIGLCEPGPSYELHPGPFALMQIKLKSSSWVSLERDEE